MYRLFLWPLGDVALGPFAVARSDLLDALTWVLTVIIDTVAVIIDTVAG